jgi:hypothetical protein
VKQGLDIECREISLGALTAFVRQHHYSKKMPRHTKACYGGYRDGALVAVVSFGWGPRPEDTIRLIFPSLKTTDYLEIGKLCLCDEEPYNSESYFLSRAIKQLRKKFPVKVIFTWADGMRGKPGYVYQAAGFLYGGFRWTDTYVMEDGQQLHPLSLRSERRVRGLDTRLRCQRPTAGEMRRDGWKHYHGKQFRYVRLFVTGNNKARRERERQKLLAESPFTWSLDYPKTDALEWKVSLDSGLKESCAQPTITGTWEAGA